MLISVKSCRWCGIEKELKEFSRHKLMPDGHINKCKTCEKEYHKIYHQKNIDEIKNKKKKYRERYKLAKRTDKYKQVRNEGRRKRYKKDPDYRLKCILRSRLKAAIRGIGKKESALLYFGCTISYLKSYLELKFTDGMTWENQGEWHIDHIRPLSSFNLNNEEEIYKACNYTNLQPLWAKDNLVKSDKTDESC